MLNSDGVVLLGYGWRLLPDEIPAAEFEALLPHLTAQSVAKKLAETA